MTLAVHEVLQGQAPTTFFGTLHTHADDDTGQRDMVASLHVWQWPGLGDVWLDPRAVFLFGAGTVPARGPLSFSPPLPVGAFPSGAVFATQAVVFDEGTFRLTPPVGLVLLPYGNVGP